MTECLTIIVVQSSSITTDFWRSPTVNTIFYINMNQSNASFVDSSWKDHSVVNDWIQYNANWIVEWCWFNNQNKKRILASFNSWESFPSQFTIMAFMKPTWNHYDSDHPIGISIANATTKNTRWIWFTQTNSQVQFDFLKENVSRTNLNTTPSSWNILNTRHHYVLTFDWTTMKWYIDWIQRVSQNISWSWTWTWPVWWFVVFWRNHANYTNTINWYVDEAIAENRVWTQTEIQTYLQKVWFIS